MIHKPTTVCLWGFALLNIISCIPQIYTYSALMLNYSLWHITVKWITYLGTSLSTWMVSRDNISISSSWLMSEGINRGRAARQVFSSPTFGLRSPLQKTGTEKLLSSEMIVIKDRRNYYRHGEKLLKTWWQRNNIQCLYFNVEHSPACLWCLHVKRMQSIEIVHWTACIHSYKLHLLEKSL